MREIMAGVVLLALTLLWSSCGDPLADETYRGRGLFSLKGLITSVTDTVFEDGVEVRVCLAWAPPGDTQPSVEDLVEQNSASARLQFPAQFELNIFNPPEPEHLHGGDGDFGVGYILLYRDRNGNEKLDGDELVGGAPRFVVLYAHHDLSAEQSPTGVEVPAGFSLSLLPLCVERAEDDWEPCPNSFGQACSTDEDCEGGGRCLEELLGVDFTGGYCVLPEENGCIGAGLMPVWDEEEDREVAFWYQSCQEEGDCREDYECMAGLELCLPWIPIWVEVDEPFSLPHLCAEGWEF